MKPAEVHKRPFLERAESSDRCIETVEISIGLVLLNDLIIKNPGRNEKNLKIS